MISRRSLFGFLAAAPFGAVAAVKAAAEPVSSLTPSERWVLMRNAVMAAARKSVDPPVCWISTWTAPDLLPDEVVKIRRRAAWLREGERRGMF